jgi:2,4-dienoyl-CoA reductase-like NADH-dependent reductase (Old Yellow Enzyme family)
MYVLRGSMPVKILTHFMENKMMKLFVGLLGNQLIKKETFSEAYFLEDAMKFRSQLKLPLVYVGGLLSQEKINEVLECGFEMVALARALIKDPDFVNKLLRRSLSRSSCDTCNYCVAAMYSRQVACIQNENTNPEILQLLHNR